MKDRKILIIAAHPDDEILGCGGTIAKLSNANKVFALILGEGVRSRNLEDSEEKINLLRNQSMSAQKLLGIKHSLFENLPDNSFDSLPLLEITQTVEKYVFNIVPDIIFTHHHADLNIDHRLTFQAVLTACRPQPKFHHPDIYSFEIPSSTEWQVYTANTTFMPNIFIDIMDSIDKKLDALKYFKSEMEEYPHSRSLKGVEIMAQNWGRKVGKEYVEAFELIRSIREEI